VAVTSAAGHTAQAVTEGAQVIEERVPIEQVMQIFLRKPGFLLNRIDQIANALYGALAECDETLPQAEMVLAIAGREGSDQVGLARACGIDTSTTAIILDNLEMTGLVARVQDARDRRRSLPVLTEVGFARLPAIRASFEALQAELLCPLEPAMVTSLLEQLVLIVESGNDSAPRWDREGSPLADAPSMLFRRALQISHARFNAEVAPIPVTLRQFSALVILNLHPALSQVDFARVYGLDPSTCAVVLKKLAARGLLRTVPSEQDKRKTLYFVTEEGRRQIGVLQACADRSEAFALADLSAQSFEKLLPPLQAVARQHSPRLRYPGSLPWDDAAPRNTID
jgi:DNA-binding MarR family transcriptional regulator